MPACTDTIFEYFMLSYFHFQSNSSFHNNLTEFFKRSYRDAFWPLATYRSNNFLHEFVEISKLKHFFINWSVIWYTISNKIANHAQSIIIILPIWSELFANSRSWLKMAWEYTFIAVKEFWTTDLCTCCRCPGRPSCRRAARRQRTLSWGVSYTWPLGPLPVQHWGIPVNLTSHSSMTR